MFRTVINAGQAALLSAFLMSSGAVVALLAFLGKLSEKHIDQIPVFATSMYAFVAGVFCVGLAYGVTFLVQNFYAGEKPWMDKTGSWLNVVAIILVLGNYGLFVWGTIIAYHAFLKFK
jgi:hypothetical protein